MSTFPPLHGQFGSGSGLSESSYGVWGDSDIGAGVIGTSSSSAGVYGQNDLSNGIGVTGQAQFGTGVLGGGATGVQGGSNAGTGVEGESRTGTGVHGQSGSGVGVSGDSLFGTGVAGSSTDSYGVSGTGGDIGVYTHNLTTAGNSAYLGTRGLAGDFYGEVFFHNAIHKQGGGFQIDHPLDPSEKYLFHSFVKSPDMKNIYDGIVVLDGSGEAEVELPVWFEPLNTDFRYQLTCIGGYAPVYIAQEVHGNRFKIAGGPPTLRVSWQVTGIRQDAWAKAHRLQVEEEKTVEERGSYLHPELHGAPKEKSIERVRYPRRTLQVP